MEGEHTMTLVEFLKEFEKVPRATEIIFGNGNLQFYRTKWRGDKLLQIEFNHNTWPSVYDKEEMKEARKVGLFIP